MSPLLDLFVTLLSMGEEGYVGLLKKRKEVYTYFQTKLKEFCEKRQVGEKKGEEGGRKGRWSFLRENDCIDFYFIISGY